MSSGNEFPGDPRTQTIQMNCCSDKEMCIVCLRNNQHYSYNLYDYEQTDEHRNKSRKDSLYEIHMQSKDKNILRTKLQPKEIQDLKTLKNG